MATLAIIGLGLIGGSLGLALRSSGYKVIGCSRSRDTVSRALARGVIDHAAESPEEAAASAEMVILATPVLAMEEALRQISRTLKPGAVVTDTASTKREVLGWAKRYLPRGVNFIGGHPMAGREIWGLEAATPDLFRDAVYCITPAADASPEAVDRVVEMVSRIGARPFFIEAEEHDYLTAGISHLPLLLSVALTMTVAEVQGRERLLKLAATGFRDVTRLASGNPVMGRDILFTNRDMLRLWLHRIRERLNALERLLEDREGLREELEKALSLREAWLRQKGWK